MDIFFILLLFIGLLTVIWWILHGLWYFLDSSFRPSVRGSGKVMRKHYIPPSVSPMPVGAGGVAPYKCPEEYELIIQTKDGQGKISVKAHFYHSVLVDSDVYVTYSRGRFSRKVYIWKVQELSIWVPDHPF